MCTEIAGWLGTARRRICLASCLVLGVPALAAAAGGDPVACTGSPVVVAGAAPAERAYLCDGADRALRQLRVIGLAVPQRIRIDVVERLPTLHGAHPYGDFSAADRRIRLLGYADCRDAAQRHMLFGEPMSPGLYRGLVAHEVAHLVLDANLELAPQRALVTHEYLAYSVQLAVLPPALRQRILARQRIAAFEDEFAVSETLYLLDPHAFGVAAYRHFAACADRLAFIRRLACSESVP